MHSISLLTFLAGALFVNALQVTQPSNTSSWSSTDTNTLSWVRVDTDPTNFTVVLTNTDRSVMPTNNQVLSDFVDATSATSTSISPPSGGYNVGGTYRVNLVKSSTELSTIYAQSDEFDIVAGTASASGSSTSSGSASGSTTGSTTGSSTDSSSGSSTASASGSGASASASSAAGASRPLELGFLGAMIALGAVVA